MWQLRGQAEQRQVEGARLALQHNLGLGGACVVTLYEREELHMIDTPSHRPRVAGVRCPVEAGRLRFFAKATGKTDPIYVDEAAARDAGHPDLPVPPTFFFCLEMESPDPAALRKLLGIDYRRMLHGEQQLHLPRDGPCRRPLRFEPRIADIYDKKGGALEFVRARDAVTNQHGELVGRAALPDGDGGHVATAARGHCSMPSRIRARRLSRATTIEVGSALPPLRAEPISRADARAVLRRLGRPQPDPRRHRLRARRRHGRRVRARHAVDGLPRRACSRAGCRSARCAPGRALRRASRTSATDSPAARRWPRSCRGAQVRLALSVRDESGIEKLAGEAVVELQK